MREGGCYGRELPSQEPVPDDLEGPQPGWKTETWAGISTAERALDRSGVSADHFAEETRPASLEPTQPHPRTRSNLRVLLWPRVPPTMGAHVAFESSISKILPTWDKRDETGENEDKLSDFQDSTVDRVIK